MASKIQTLRYREKNPNLFQLRLSRAGVAMLPVTGQQLFLEIRREPAGRLLYSLPLVRPLTTDTLLTASLPAELVTGLYYVDLRVEPVAGPAYRTGLCMISMLAVGSLETISEVQGLNVTISETAQVLTAELDATPSAALAAGYAQQAQAARDQTLLARNEAVAATGNVMVLISQDATSIKLALGSAIAITDHPDAHYPYVTLDLL